MNSTANIARISNPFVPIDKKWRIALLVYIVLYNMVNPVVSELFVSSAPLAFPRVLVQLIYQFVLFIPLFFYHKSWGWLHPLIFPVVFSLLLSIGQDPFSLIHLFSISAAENLSHPALSGFSEYEIAMTYIKADLVQILALLMFYAGFFASVNFPVPKLRFNAPKRFIGKIFVFVGIALVLFAYFLQQFGGLGNIILAFAGSRFATLEGTGHIRALINAFSVGAALAWYAFRPEAMRNPVFIAIFCFTVLVGFLTSGSRSSIFFTLALFLMIWMIRHRKIPAAKSLVIIVVGFLFLGVLGELRNYGLRSDTLDWSIITERSITERFQSTTEDIERRSSGYVAVVGKGIEEEGLLWGRTYLGAVFFWVPRAIWSSKPRGAGAYTGNLLYRGGSLEGDPSGGIGGGSPPGGVGEAYWNFHIPGVIIVYFLFGMTMKWLARLLRRYPNQPAVWVLYVIILFNIDTQTINLVSLFQIIVAVIVLLYWLKSIKIK